MKKSIKQGYSSKKGYQVAILLGFIFTTTVFAADPVQHDIRQGEGVTRTTTLSEYFPALTGTPGDTTVYIMDSGIEGGTLLLLGGTHANEIAGVIAAVIAVEKGIVSSGRIIVIPHTNNSASRHNQGTFNPGSPQWIELKNSAGETRRFLYGDRYTQPEDQAVDPEIFIHNPSGMEFKGAEARNLNRNHPGKADGTLTQQISYALFQLVEKEEVDVLIDMHEASVTSRLAFTLVAHPRALEIAAMAKMDLEMNDINMTLEVSSDKFHGLSHREFGDHSNVLAFLTETPNPGMEKSIEHPDVINDPDNPLNMRLQVVLKSILAILDNYKIMNDQKKAITIGFPFPLSDLKNTNPGEFLR
jgi:Succinylglutamate desuccinylase / Aspartoacylase family